MRWETLLLVLFALGLSGFVYGGFWYVLHLGGL